MDYNYAKTVLDPFTGVPIPSPSFSSEEAYDGSPQTQWRGRAILTVEIALRFNSRSQYAYNQMVNNWNDMNPGGWTAGSNFTTINRTWEFYHFDKHTNDFQ